MSIIDTIAKDCETLFSERQYMLTLWQCIADYFYVERANFTTEIVMGEDLGKHLAGSESMLMRRDFANLLAAMLRPSTKKWFKIGVGVDVETKGRTDLEAVQASMWRDMYNPRSRFVRSAKEADNDYATFGNAVMSCEMSYDVNLPVFRTWHLKDVVWRHDYYGKLSHVYRKGECTISDLNKRFNGNISEQLKKRLQKEPNVKVCYVHGVFPKEQYEGKLSANKSPATPFVSVFWEKDTKHVLDETLSADVKYICPRWQTVSGSQYGYSPATVAGLPEARFMDMIKRDVVEASNYASIPRFKAVAEILKSPANLQELGITYVSPDYDGRGLAGIEQLDVQSRGLQYAFELMQNSKEIMRQCWFLDRLTLPVMDGTQRTAYEMQQRTSEYIRGALPLFETMEQEYSAQICERHFEVKRNARAFENMNEWGADLMGDDIHFSFETPLSEAIEREAPNRLGEIIQIGTLAQGAGIQEPFASLDMEGLLFDAYAGIGVPAKRIVEPDEAMFSEAEKIEMQINQLAQAAQAAGAVPQLGGGMPQEMMGMM